MYIDSTFLSRPSYFMTVVPSVEIQGLVVLWCMVGYVVDPWVFTRVILLNSFSSSQASTRLPTYLHTIAYPWTWASGSIGRPPDGRHHKFLLPFLFNTLGLLSYYPLQNSIWAGVDRNSLYWFPKCSGGL
ncbi:hypothetical protein [Pasteuria penetrans]|uniref:hypothetical protein n=1 Tax=Pasteuria penetrans TaxID=86005 RepID=UPI001CAA5739|nr:hypothetical protein [Pasteuria penetrans]